MSHSYPPGVKPFEYNRLSDRLLAGRNPLIARDVERLVAEGVTHILDLREEQEWQPPRLGGEALMAMERHGLCRLHLPIADTEPPTQENIETAIAFLKTASGQKGTQVYVHCRAGWERTACVLVAYHAVAHGVSYEVALQTLQQARPVFQPLPAQETAARNWIQTKAAAGSTSI